MGGGMCVRVCVCVDGCNHEANQFFTNFYQILK